MSFKNGGGVMKMMQNVLKRKNQEGYQVILNYSLKIIRFRPFWIYWYAYKKKIKKKSHFFKVRQKKFAVVDFMTRYKYTWTSLSYLALICIKHYFSISQNAKGLYTKSKIIKKKKNLIYKYWWPISVGLLLYPIQHNSISIYL